MCDTMYCAPTPLFTQQELIECVVERRSSFRTLRRTDDLVAIRAHHSMTTDIAHSHALLKIPRVAWRAAPSNALSAPIELGAYSKITGTVTPSFAAFAGNALRSVATRLLNRTFSPSSCARSIPYTAPC